MTIENEYFDWLIGGVIDRGHSNYTRLLKHLYSLDFTPILCMDSNRGEDGKFLRWTFGRKEKFERNVIEEWVRTKPCSVLEMMIALAGRIENDIMDSLYEDRTSEWFWYMIESLGLSYMTDDEFDSRYVDGVIEKLNNNEYKPDGKGGLFYIPGTHDDLRNVEIWYQMQQFLINKGGQL